MIGRHAKPPLGVVDHRTAAQLIPSAALHGRQNVRQLILQLRVTLVRMYGPGVQHGQLS